MTFETFDQSDEETWLDQKKTCLPSYLSSIHLPTNLPIYLPQRTPWGAILPTNIPTYIYVPTYLHPSENTHISNVYFSCRKMYSSGIVVHISIISGPNFQLGKSQLGPNLLAAAFELLRACFSIHWYHQPSGSVKVWERDSDFCGPASDNCSDWNCFFISPSNVHPSEFAIFWKNNFRFHIFPDWNFCGKSSGEAWDPCKVGISICSTSYIGSQNITKWCTHTLV